MSYRNPKAFPRTIVVRNTVHPCTDTEVNIVRFALERYARTEHNDRWRRVARGLLHLWCTGVAPDEFEDVRAWRRQVLADASR